MAKKSAKSKLIVEAIRHEDASRKNIPTAECESVMEETAKYDVRIAYVVTETLIHNCRFVPGSSERF